MEQMGNMERAVVKSQGIIRSLVLSKLDDIMTMDEVFKLLRGVAIISDAQIEALEHHIDTLNNLEEYKK